MRKFSFMMLCILACTVLATAQKKLYVKDMKFVTKEIGKKCKDLIKEKKIPWKKISKEFNKKAAQSKSHNEHLRLLIRLLARLQDGHARVQPGDNEPKNTNPFPEFKNYTGAAIFLCRNGKKLFIKTAWGEAKSAGLKPGMEVVSVNGEKAMDWLGSRLAWHRDTMSFSTQQHAEFFALQRGLSAPKGTRWKLIVKDETGRKKKKTLTFTRAKQVPDGPAFFPKGIRRSKKRNVHFATTPEGFGYIHLRRCKSTVVEEVDEALGAIGNPKGMILDFRGNTGGGFDHEALFGRFIPQGKSFKFKKGYRSAGPKNYGGPLVVIVDGSVVSAGETASGMFKEDGRAYMIGESPTAGMSSSKVLIDLPSRFFKVRVSVYSNKKRFNSGKGIEGVGVPPQEIVPLQPQDLVKGIDTLIARAIILLEDFPQKEVPYDPKKFGWQSD